MYGILPKWCIVPGFSLMESGYVQKKNGVNQMMLNVVDMLFSGLSYWMVGHGIIYGKDPGTTSFAGFGYFFFQTSVVTSGSMYSIFVFELSLATISTTIITGAIAERASTAVWCIYAFLSTFVYAFPACWMWGSQGFLRQRGAVDVGGGLVVQTVGATQALVYCLLLGRRNREKSSVPRSIPDPNNALVGYFMLLWGFLGLTSGSAFGVRGTKWHLVAKAATTTILSAMVGFSWGLVLSHIVTRVRTGKGRYFVRDMMQGSLGAVVAITASAPLVSPWSSIIISSIAAVLVLAAGKLFSHIGLDDPCSVVAVHGVGGIWGTIAVGFFSRVEHTGFHITSSLMGISHGGNGELLLIQLAAILCCVCWAAVTSLIILLVTKKFVGLRVSEEVENDGLDKHTHGIVPNVENWEFKIANFPIVVRENSGSAPSTTSDNEPSETHQLSFWKDRQEWAGSTSVSSVAGLIQDHEDENILIDKSGFEVLRVPNAATSAMGQRKRPTTTASFVNRLGVNRKKNIPFKL